MADGQQRDPLKEIEGLSDLPKPIDVELKPSADDKDAKDPKKEDVEGKDKAKPTDEPKADDENVAALRRQLAAEKRGREAAEARNAEVERQRQKAEEQTAEGQLRLITSSLDSATADRARAKADLAKAMGEGDWNKATDAQEILNDAQIRVDRLTHGKAEMERRAEAEKTQREEAARRQPVVHDDPVEALIHNARLSSKSASWLRANPDCVTDQRKNRQMIRAHEDAGDEGIEADTPEYFAFIEKRLGIGHSDDPEPQRRQQTQKRESAADTAAPVSRGPSTNGRGSRENTVTLSPLQRQFCDENGISYEQYARNLVSLRKEGRLQ